jgi:hypothetical protein
MHSRPVLIMCLVVFFLKASTNLLGYTKNIPFIIAATRCSYGKQSVATYLPTARNLTVLDTLIL